jgi:hypothetical protein
MLILYQRGYSIDEQGFGQCKFFLIRFSEQIPSAVFLKNANKVIFAY